MLFVLRQGVGIDETPVTPKENGGYVNVNGEAQAGEWGEV